MVSDYTKSIAKTVFQAGVEWQQYAHMLGRGPSESMLEARMYHLVDTALANARLEGAKAGLEVAAAWHEAKAAECEQHGFRKQAESHRIDAEGIRALDQQQVINESMGNGK